MGFFSGILKAAAPIVGGALGSMVLPGIGTAIGSSLGGMIGGGSQDEGPQQYPGGTPYDWSQAAGSFASGLPNMIQSGMSMNSAQGVNAQNQANFNAQMQFNKDNAQANRDFQANMQGNQQEFNSWAAQANRDWQTQMSNTQYQRAVGDMEAAGLNPMLAYSQGGAGVPSGGAASSGQASGSQASAPAAPQLRNVVADAISSAVALKDVDSRADLQSAQALAVNAETDKSIAGTKEIEQRTKNLVIEVSKIQNQAALLDEQKMSMADQRNLWRAQEALAKAQKGLADGQLPYYQALQMKASAEATITQLAKPGAENEARFQRENPSVIQGSRFGQTLFNTIPGFSMSMPGKFGGGFAVR